MPWRATATISTHPEEGRRDHDLGHRDVGSVKQLTDNLDKRTAEITTGVLQVTDSANKQINIVGGDAHRAINNIDKAVSDLAKHPSRILFGGGQ